MSKKRINKRVLFMSVGIGLIVAFFIAISMGSVEIPIGEIISIVMSREKSRNYGILMDIRIPRVLIAILVGASLAVSGVLLQAVMRNPLADPGITGISSGASVTTMLMMLYFPQFAVITPIVGFMGGLIACILVYSLAWKKGISAIRIVLAGIAVNSVLGGISGMLSIVNSDKLAGVLMWMNGNIGNKSWTDVKILAFYTIIGLVVAYPLFKVCNLLSLGDKTAQGLGVNVHRQRMIISAVAVFLAGITTSIAGIIGFVGLVVPHIARMIIGTDHKYLLPFSALTGALIVLIADTFGRTIASPYEIPVGIVMAVLGGPFFLYLLRKGGTNYGS